MTSNQLELALADRRDGQEANLAAGATGHRDDTSRVTTAIAQLARSGRTFTANDVHAALKADGGGDYNRNLVSSRMGILAAEGAIVRAWDIHPEPAIQRSRKGSRNPWWCGRTDNHRSDAA